MWNDMIGARSQVVRNPVEEGAVRKFAEAIGDPNPLYFDMDVGAASHWGRRIAPPTFPRTFEYGHIPGFFLPPSGVIHGEQGFRYQRPIFVGEDLWCAWQLKNVYQRQGRAGEMTFLVLERYGDDSAGDRVFASDDVYVITEAVLRSMQQ
jgi:acyl dehydratase